jgi:hypothetical protein
MQDTSPSDLNLLKFRHFPFFLLVISSSAMYFHQCPVSFSLSFLVRAYVTQVRKRSQKRLKSYIPVDFYFMLDKARKNKISWNPNEKVPKIVTVFNSALNLILIFYRPYQTDLLRGCKIFEGFIFHLYIKLLSCIWTTRLEKVIITY